jgi:hypothetical protein
VNAAATVLGLSDVLNRCPDAFAIEKWRAVSKLEPVMAVLLHGVTSVRVLSHQISAEDEQILEGRLSD